MDRIDAQLFRDSVLRWLMGNFWFMLGWFRKPFFFKGENITQKSIIVLIFFSVEQGIVKIFKEKKKKTCFIGWWSVGQQLPIYLFMCIKYMYKNFQIVVKVKFLISLWLSWTRFLLGMPYRSRTLPRGGRTGEIRNQGPRANGTSKPEGNYRRRRNAGIIIIF